jgi:Uma2 family endonuclease
MYNTLIRVKNRLSDEEFFELCQMNELRMERDKNGTILMMEPTGSETGNFNSEINGELSYWNKTTQNGKTFDSSTGFILPDTAVRSPDASWIKKERWSQIEKDLRKKFAPIAPDFVLEIRSESDRLPELKTKMEEYIANSVRLAWLIDRENEETTVYRIDGTTGKVPFSEYLDGEDVLVGFKLKINDLDID